MSIIYKYSVVLYYLLRDSILKQVGCASTTITYKAITNSMTSLRFFSLSSIKKKKKNH